MTIPNVPGLRFQALSRLKTQKRWRGFTDEELLYVASRIGDVIRKDVVHPDQTEEQPLIRMLSHELEGLKTGVYEWLYAWLSPEHPAMQKAPALMTEIADKLLHDTWTETDKDRITRVRKAIRS